MRKVLHLMGALGDEDVEWLIAHGQTRFVSQGSVVIEEGRPVEAMFIVLDGQLSVRTIGAGGGQVAVLYPGEVLGEISFVDARAPSASVVAVQDSSLFAMSKEVLTRKLDRDDAFAARFYKALAIFLADRLRTTTGHLGYGKWREGDPDEIQDAELDNVSLAAVRFDQMLRRLRMN